MRKTSQRNPKPCSNCPVASPPASTAAGSAAKARLQTPRLRELRSRALGECADHDVVTFWIAKRKLSCACGGIHLRFLVESGDQSASSLQCDVEVIDPENKKKP